MGKVTLSARVVQKEEDGYLAAIDGLNLAGKGVTVKDAQDDLVERFRSWVQAGDGQGTLEALFLTAGYAGVDEDTELELQFVE